MQHGIIIERSQELVDFAVKFANEAHGDQKRKYTGEPYIHHPVAVAKIVREAGGGVNMVCAAILHDVLEDTPVTYQELCDAGFNWVIADLVMEVTDVSKPEDGNRKARKSLDRDHLAGASPEGQTIKLADLINNTESITKYDPQFAKIYMAEKRELLKVLKDGDKGLWEKANKICEDFFNP